jgi:hypothetical protein
LPTCDKSLTTKREALPYPPVQALSRSFVIRPPITVSPKVALLSALFEWRTA